MKSHRATTLALCFGATLLGATVLLAEATLQITARIWRKADFVMHQYGALLADKQGGVSQGNPLWPDHDARGYRNPRALTGAEIVAIGDSHTYGTSVSSADAWPAMLAERFKTTVYNMGLPGTGPMQSLEFLHMAAELHPRIVLFGVSFGNDLINDFLFARKKGRLAEFVSGDDLASIDAVETSSPLAEKIGDLYRSGERDESVARQIASHRSFVQRVKSFLSRNSRLYNFLRFLRDQVSSRRLASPILAPRFEDALAGLRDYQRPYVSAFSDGRWKTLFTSPYRLATLDHSDIRVRAGMAIAKRAMQRMHEFCVSRGITFVVVLLPIKESVFADRVRDPGSHKDYGRLLEEEARARLDIMGFLRDNNIVFVDPLPMLRRSTAQPYFEDGDGHPNVVGHDVITTAILEQTTIR